MANTEEIYKVLDNLLDMADVTERFVFELNTKTGILAASEYGEEGELQTVYRFAITPGVPRAVSPIMKLVDEFNKGFISQEQFERRVTSASTRI